MSDQRTQQEPSMEEILASIRRIISEDGENEQPAQPKAAPEPARAVDEDVLELTQMIKDDGGSDSAPFTDDSWEAPEPPRMQQPPPQPQPQMQPQPQPQQFAMDDGGLVSAAPAAQTAAHFAALHNSVGLERQWPIGMQIRTVEDVVRDLLRPMLKEWLDENLPTLVERLVQRELDKMSRRAGFE